MKIQHFKPSLVTKSFFPEYDDVAIINHGECFIWAYAAFMMFEGIELWYNGCHAFVRYRGRFYDSEVLRGSRDWADLPATEGGGVPIQVPVSKFRLDWGGNPREFNTSWKEVESRARKALRRYRTKKDM